MLELLEIFARSSDHADADDGHRTIGQGDQILASDAGVIDGLLFPLLDEQVCVVAAKAEVVDRGATQPIDLPWLGGRERSEGGLVEPFDRLVGVQRGGANAMLHRSEHLEQARDARCRDQVTHIGLERTDGHIVDLFEDARHAAKLGAITERRACRVALHERDVLGGKPGHLVGVAHRAPLAILGRREHPATAAIIGEADAANHTSDGVPITHGVLEALEHHKARAFCRDEAIGALVEGARAPRLAHRIEGAEADVEEQVIGVVHATCEHHIGAPFLEAITRDLDGVERGRARRIQREGAPMQPQRLRDEV